MADKEMAIIHSEAFATSDGSEVEQELQVEYCGRGETNDPMVLVRQRLGCTEDIVVLTLSQLKRIINKLERHSATAEW